MLVMTDSCKNTQDTTVCCVWGCAVISLGDQMSIILIKFTCTPACLQEYPDVIQQHSVAELKLQTKRYLQKGED